MSLDNVRKYHIWNEIDVQPRTMTAQAGYPTQSRTRNISQAQNEFKLITKLDECISQNEKQALTIMEKNNDLEHSKLVVKDYFRENK